MVVDNSRTVTYLLDTNDMEELLAVQKRPDIDTSKPVDPLTMSNYLLQRRWKYLAMRPRRPLQTV